MFHRSESESESFRGEPNGVQAVLDAHVRVGARAQDWHVLPSKQGEGSAYSVYDRTGMSNVLGLEWSFANPHVTNVFYTRRDRCALVKSVRVAKASTSLERVKHNATERFRL